MWDEDVDIDNFFHYVTIFINGVCSGQKYLCKREKKIFSRALRKWPERRIQFKVKHAIGFATRLFEEHSKR